MRKAKIFILITCLLLLTGCGNKNEIADLNDQIEELNSQNINLKVSNDELAKRNDELTSKYDAIVKEYDNKKAELQAEIEIKEKIIDELNSEQDNNQENYITPIINDISMSPDGHYALVTIYDNNQGNTAILYDFDSGLKEVITHGLVCQTYWSPDSKYYILDEGTFVTRSGTLYSVQSTKVIKSLSYDYELFWINQEEIVYLRENQDIIFDEGVEPPYTDDVIIHNLFTDEIKTIFEGTNQYSYDISSIEDGNIICLKKYKRSKTEDIESEIVVYDLK